MKVAVIGAGTMGRGIAQAFAQCADVEKVYLCDIKQEFADGGKAKVKASLDKRVAKGKMTQEAEDAILNKMQTGLNSQAVDPDLVVEAALEVMDIKKSTFKDLEENIVKNDKCIFATNTSSLSVTEIGAGLKKPVIGMHFFNPAPVMKLVEVIKGANTSDEDVKAVKEIAVKLGKTPVEVNEAPGFVVNRILIPMINEGIQVYSEGVSNIEGIDTAMKLGCNHPMGPLELGDFIGLDIVLAIMDTLYKETGDSKYRPAMLLRKMVRGGHLGVKTGIGFYKYNADRTKTPVDEL
ncbi:MAG: 3-hydroxyacyl-CoA dehydrogenase NAD-binding domain-containing protein [Erysipelotrichaceae bacterium]|jgi:3-hydroxybutyryl-CoA dehydrogenase|uniref:3-hydroxyacyl-CoA dehydrogenase NAD-binding domain-containing protein n=1 Tax=Grylomicrobium aquisgranensis TaxID=2926318 RepID=A0AB35U6M1_9FIRM|nr:3-hydroxyacyl-CoA dehydrogenase NAD-binding domain-containing protein [Lactimicrobium massiliense]MCH4019490.1 3-hydroxyacyl-CoA dehydrogenase NAD-binding domain-containing protein [Erysipelotrichaceae bacterium]MCI1326494.1 3-hydroxyacyl-CoA dehydrogenase NAD-binding domain-containing protein [Solobacterium sp.]MDX8419492.1 3-hydroxyacyl-CoA dehydrogenase NAD-binding domain-containing protein [Stecheria sp. CLA-KB-P133]MCH4045514.1 3-hydroxyacyl-CoA dehydrogenase NAD-binding domain-containi